MEKPHSVKNNVMDDVFAKVLRAPKNQQKTAGALLNDWFDNVCRLWAQVHKELTDNPDNLYILKEIGDNNVVGMKLKTLHEDYGKVKSAVESDFNHAAEERPGIRDDLVQKKVSLDRKVRVLDILSRCEASISKGHHQLDKKMASVASSHMSALHGCLGELRTVLAEVGKPSGPDQDTFFYIEEAVSAEVVLLECQLLRQLGDTIASHFVFERVDQMVIAPKGGDAGSGAADDVDDLVRLEVLTLPGEISTETFREQVREVAVALHNASGPHQDALDAYLGRWCSRLLTHVVQPLLTSICTCTLGDNTLEVAVAREFSTPDILQVSYDLIKILDFLDERFFSIEIDTESAKTIGQKVGDKLATPLITSYSRMVDDHFSQVETSIGPYEKTIKAVLEVERSCIKCGILAGPHEFLNTYRRNANTILLESRRTGFLEQARQAARDPLHVTQSHNTTVERKKDSGPSEIEDSQTTIDGDESEVVEQEHEDVEEDSEDTMDTVYTELPFPDCEISVSVVKVVSILEACMREAYTCAKDDTADNGWFVAARSVVDLFTKLTLLIHKQELETVPLASGLYYNNCNYLVRELERLTRTYAFSIYCITKNRNSFPKDFSLFTDFRGKVEASGQQIWQQQTSKLNQDLLDSLSGANGLSKPSVEYENCIRAVKRCLHQLGQVRKVWDAVMPQSVWQRTIACLANNLLLQINAMVMSREDISANDALALRKIMNKLEDAIPEIVQMADGSGPGVHRLVPVWSRFLELKWLLTAPLREIAGRWSRGAGVLAAVMSMQEVRHIIKAVFQNTEMRSEVLYEISYTSVPEPGPAMEATKKNPDLAAFSDIS